MSGARYNTSNASLTSFGVLAIIGTIGYIVGYIWIAMESYYYKIAYLIGAENENL